MSGHEGLGIEKRLAEIARRSKAMSDSLGIGGTRRRADELAITLSGHLGSWARAVSVQSERVHHEHASRADRQVDANLLVLALRNVRRAAVAVAAVHPETRMAEVLDRFDRLVPDATNLRDVLEHFDDYEIGAGRLQRPGAGNRWHAYYERGPDHYVLHVGDLTLNVDEAAEAALNLTEVALHAIDRIVAAEARTRRGRGNTAGAERETAPGNES